MNKKTFLTSIAVLAASLAVDASASLPDSVHEKLITSSTNQNEIKNEQLMSPNSFVLQTPTNGDISVAEHYSHRSHSSHRSHVSSRY